jgi:hypothetical protein
VATYQANHVEFARFMKSDEIGQHLKNEAERLAAHLRETAPRGETGVYAGNFKVATGLDILRRDRAAAFVYNDTRYATALEVGSWNIRNPPSPMTKALNAFKT